MCETNNRGDREPGNEGGEFTEKALEVGWLSAAQFTGEPLKSEVTTE